MTSPVDPVVYRPLRVMRFLVLAVLLGLAAAVWIVVQVVRGGDGAPPWFTAVWLGILAWNAYWWLFRICTEVRVEDGRLAWRTPLRRSEVPLTDVLRIRPSRTGQRQMAVVELQDHRPLLVPVRYGFQRLSRALTDAVPGLRVDA